VADPLTTRVFPIALVLLCCVPRFAAADEAYAPTNLTAADILQKAKAARGTLAPGNYKYVEVSQGGGLDQTTTVYIGGNDWIAHAEAGPFTTASGSFQKQSWRQNENGIVTRDTAADSSTDPDAAALLQPDAEHSVVALGITDDTPPLYAIDVDPPGGEHQIRYYDAQTFLLAKVVTWGKDRLQHVEIYGDYRRVFGAVRAFRTTYSDGRTDNDTTTTITSYETAKDVPSFQIPATKSVVTFPSVAPVVLPARFIHGAIVVRTTIGGRGLDFLLDTGDAAGITIDPGVAHQLGLITYDRRSATVGGSYDVARTIVPEMTIGNLHLHDAVFTEAPLPSAATGYVSVVGALCFDFIDSAVVAIDFKNETVTLYPPGCAIPNAAALVALPIGLRNGAPRVAASFADIPGNFLIDTGAPQILLFKSYLDRLPKMAPAPGQIQMNFVGGGVTGKMFYVDDLHFGSTHFERVNAFVPESSTVDLHGYDGIIGRSVLKFYTVYFDYANQQIYLLRN
jgi:predicted aspartyl protease